MTWTMVDTFSGIGGFSLAAEWTGRIRPVQFIEIDPWCRRVLAKHWPGVPIHDDIKTFLADSLSERDANNGRGQLRARDAADADSAGRGEHRWSLDVSAQLATAERGSGERHAGVEVECSLGDAPHDVPGRLVGRPAARPAFPFPVTGPDWEGDIPRVTTHEEDRVSKLKALGNAIIPQVAYELMLMLLAVDDACRDT